MTAVEETLNSNFFIITGGPGAGKTALCSALEDQKFKCVPEAAREIIKEQMKIDGEALPWKNRELYAQLMLKRSIESYLRANHKNLGIVFFDRGILDTLCYAKLISIDITDEMSNAAKAYGFNKNVFVLPPWFEIYTADDERKQTWEEAVLTYENIVATYQAYDYHLIEIPRTSIDSRLDFILSTIKLM